VKRKSYCDPYNDANDVLSRKERRDESFHDFEDHKILGVRVALTSWRLTESVRKQLSPLSRLASCSQLRPATTWRLPNVC
jgi:hypothetical protein